MFPRAAEAVQNMDNYLDNINGTKDLVCDLIHYKLGVERLNSPSFGGGGGQG
jgi:hypothetical protein